MSDRQTFAVGETIRQKHLDAVAPDADELTALRSQVSELRADLEVAVGALEEARKWLSGQPDRATSIHSTSFAMIEAIDATLNTIRKDG